MLELIVLPPIICGLLAFLFSKRPRISEIVAIAGVLLAAFFAFSSLWSFLNSPVGFTDFYDLLYMDSISALFTALTVTVAVFVFIYSIGYIRHEVEEKTIEEHRIGEYYGLLSFFLSVMLLATLAANIVVMWALIEATTLASVFLISFYNTSNSIEAAWKFFIINSVGILLALVGIMFLLYAVLQPGAESSGDWVSLLALRSGANIFFLKIAFVFIIVGFGTKVGFAPLHVWLPDAHSQAPTPVSALLSGVLLNIAFYGIVRAYMIISPYPELIAFASNLLIVFGLLSLAIGALRLYFQDNLKRMLAYSSVENMGIIALALGLGGPIGIFAALFHMVSHSLAKSLAFLTSGMVAFAFGTKEIRLIRGAAQKIPLVAIPFVFIAIGIAGSPPFGTFFSEIGILAVSLSTGQFAVALLFIIFTTITFASLLYRTSGMCFGEKSGNNIHFTPDLTMFLSFIALLVLAIYFGIMPPGDFIKLLQLAVQTINGG